MGFAPVFDDGFEDALGSIDVRVRGPQIVEELTSAVGGEMSDKVGILEELVVEGKFEFAADGRDTTDDVGAVDGAGVPGISGDEGSGGPDREGATIGGRDGDGFVEVTEETLDADGLVVAAGVGVEANREKADHFLEKAFEGAVGVNNDHTTHADFQEDFLEEDDGKAVGCDIGSGDADDELGEVAHAGEQVLLAFVFVNLTWAPKVTMQDEEGAGDGPAVEQFGGVASAAVGE